MGFQGMAFIIKIKDICKILLYHREQFIQTLDLVFFTELLIRCKSFIIFYKYKYKLINIFIFILHN